MERRRGIVDRFVWKRLRGSMDGITGAEDEIIRKEVLPGAVVVLQSHYSIYLSYTRRMG